MYLVYRSGCSLPRVCLTVAGKITRPCQDRQLEPPLRAIHAAGERELQLKRWGICVGPGTALLGTHSPGVRMPRWTEIPFFAKQGSWG